MKNRISMLVIISLFLTACLQEQRDDFTIRTFRGYVEDFTSVRASLDEDNKVLWEEDDILSVFEDNQYPSAYKISVTSAGKTSADFEKVSGASSGFSIGANVAMYPYSADVKCAKLSTGDCRISGFEIPSVQMYSENTFASDAFLMVARASLHEDVFSFRNLCGIMKLQLTGDEAIRYIVVKGNDGELISGPARAMVYADGSVPQLSMTSDACAEVTLDCGESGVKLDQTRVTPFLIVLPPVAFEKGFTATIVSVDGSKMELSTSKANPINRSSILRMPEKAFTPVAPNQSSATSIETVNLSFDEAIIKVTVGQAVQYSGGYKLKSDFNLNQIVREANWKIAPRIYDSFVYEGPMTAFPSGETTASLSVGQTYVVWVAPYAAGQTKVTSDQIVFREIIIPDITPGGSKDVSVMSFDAGVKHVSANVSSSGARSIYAAFLTSSELSSISSDDDIVEWLKKNVAPIAGESGEVIRSDLSPGESLQLLAVAVDDLGRYGSVLKASYSTIVPVFNEDITISLTAVCEGKIANVKVSASGADIIKYYYFTGSTSGSSWLKVLGGTNESAEDFIVINNGNYLINNTDEEPFMDGCIVMDNVMIGEEYVAVVVAEDTDGRFSRAHFVTFVPYLDLGNFMYRTGSTKALWLSSKPSVEFGRCTADGEFYIINWSVTPASGTTAYTACVHPNTMEKCTTPEEQAIMIYNLGVEVVLGKMETMLYGDKANLVYVTWVDSSGNFYEPISFAVLQ